MLNGFAFANSLGATTVLFFLAICLGNFVAPGLSKFLLNIQFLGADVSKFFPEKISWKKLLGMLIGLFIAAWFLGYVWAWLYNWFI
jgi:hypothetical protein